MTNTCTFAPTIRLLPSNQFFYSGKAVLSSFYDVNSGRKVVSAVSSWLSNMHNSLQCLHNSDWEEGIPSAELTITACEESNMLDDFQKTPLSSLKALVLADSCKAVTFESNIAWVSPIKKV